MTTKSERTEIEILKVRMGNMEEQNQKDHNAILSVSTRVEKKLDEFIRNADGKYASKDRVSLLERVVYGMVGVIIITVLYAVLKNIGINF